MPKARVSRLPIKCIDCQCFFLRNSSRQKRCKKCRVINHRKEALDYYYANCRFIELSENVARMNKQRYKR